MTDIEGIARRNAQLMAEVTRQDLVELADRLSRSADEMMAKRVGRLEQALYPRIRELESGVRELKYPDVAVELGKPNFLEELTKKHLGECKTSGCDVISHEAFRCEPCACLYALGELLERVDDMMDCHDTTAETGHETQLRMLEKLRALGEPQ